MNLGLIIVLIVIFGYISNWLNWKYLNYRITHLLYYLGAFIHESSHALLCLLTGAKIREFKVFSAQPHVTHYRSRIPLIGNLLISCAPIAGGIFFLFLVNHFILVDHFNISAIGNSWKDILLQPLSLLGQLRPYEWQAWIMLFLTLNVGAMLGPSFQDMKNVWPLIIVIFFIDSAPISELGMIALSLILAEIAVQIVAILCLKLFRIGTN